MTLIFLEQYNRRRILNVLLFPARFDMLAVITTVLLLGSVYCKTTLDVVGEVDGRVTIRVHISPANPTNGWEVLLHADTPVMTHVHVSFLFQLVFLFLMSYTDRLFYMYTSCSVCCCILFSCMCVTNSGFCVNRIFKWKIHSKMYTFTLCTCIDFLKQLIQFNSIQFNKIYLKMVTSFIGQTHIHKHLYNVYTNLYIHHTLLFMFLTTLNQSDDIICVDG